MKEILKRGYVTNALTNEKGEIYGILKDDGINWEINSIELQHRFYWSEVYCEPDTLYVIIRQGELLVNPTPEEIAHYFEQSKINLH